MSAKFKILFLYPNEPLLNPPPVSMGILSAILKGEGFDVEIFDNTFYEPQRLSSDFAKLNNLQVKPFNFEERGIRSDRGDMFLDLEKKVNQFKPDLIALSSLEGTYSMGIKMLESIRDFSAPVIAGGVFPTAAPEEVMGNPDIDFICVGEGEIALPKFCRALAEGSDPYMIKNIWAKSKEGKIIKNGFNPVADLDKLPVPDYSIFDSRRFYRPMAGKVYRTVPIETNRGCPFSCSFCNSPAVARLYRENNDRNYIRKKSIKKIYEEIKLLVKKWNAEYVYFSSDTFLCMTDSELNEFTEMYSEFGLPFWVQTRAETVTAEKMNKLKRIGCHRISMGLEHGNEEFREKMLKKNFKNRVFIEAAENINKAGIPLTVNNIIGFPFEDRELVFDTIGLNRKIKADSINAYAFYPFKGTELYGVCIKNGFIKNGVATPVCVTLGTILDMPGLSKEEIEGLMRTFVFYVRLPKKYWDRIKIAERADEAGNAEFERLKQICLKGAGQGGASIA